MNRPNVGKVLSKSWLKALVTGVLSVLDSPQKPKEKMMLEVWIPKQGWFEVSDVIRYYWDRDEIGYWPVADVVLFDGSVVTGATLAMNLLINGYGD